MATILAAVAACQSEPRTDADLMAAAHLAVDRKLDRQATFSMEESAVAEQIMCGHADYEGNPVGRDFVYRDGKVILDSDPAFDQAASQCERAAGGDGGPANNSL